MMLRARPGKLSAHRTRRRSAELADPADGLVSGLAVGDLDVVDDGAVPESPRTATR
jgi:hypothetical protein